MKYRIKQCGADKFIPQYRFWFTWFVFHKHYSPNGGFGTRTFGTLEEAKEFINKRIESNKYKVSLCKVKYHKVE